MVEEQHQFFNLVHVVLNVLYFLESKPWDWVSVLALHSGTGYPFWPRSLRRGIIFCLETLKMNRKYRFLSKLTFNVCGPNLRFLSLIWVNRCDLHMNFRKNSSTWSIWSDHLTQGLSRLLIHEQHNLVKTSKSAY